MKTLQQLTIRKFKSLQVVLFLIMILMACSDHAVSDNESTEQMQDNIDTAVTLEPIDTLARLSVLNDSIKILQSKFEYKASDFPYPTFYHENWWGRYIIADKSLTAGVDSIGQIFLFSMYEGEKPLNHDRIKIIIGGQEWTSNTKDSVSFLDDTNSLRPTSWEVNMYSDEDELIAAIAENFEKQIFYEYLGKKDTLRKELISQHKVGIRDCYLLSRLLFEKHTLINP